MKKLIGMSVALVLSFVCISEVYSQTYAPIYATRIELKNGLNKTIINPNASGGTRSISFPTDEPAEGDVLTWHTGGLLSWDAAGGGGSLTGGTADYLVKWTGSTSVGLSSIIDASGEVSTASNLNLSGANKTLKFTGDGAGYTTFAAGNQGATNIVYTLPTNDGDSGNVLMSNGSGVMSWKQQPIAIFGGSSQGNPGNNDVMSISGSGSYGSGSEPNAQVLMTRSGVLKNFHMFLTNAPGAGSSRVFTVRKNGANSSVTITIADLATSGSDVTQTLSVVAGDRISIQVVNVSGPNSATCIYGIELH